jgi:hypothetical protein
MNNLFVFPDLDQRELNTFSYRRPFMRGRLLIKGATKIKSLTIPYTLKGFDIIGYAQTGSGKTVAFKLPLLQNVLINRDAFSGLILVPSRELAFQITAQGELLGGILGIRFAVLVGGVDFVIQAAILRGKPNIIVSTSRGLVMHLGLSYYFPTEANFCFFITKSDRLLQIDFEKELNHILIHIPRNNKNFKYISTSPLNLFKSGNNELINSIQIVSPLQLFKLAKNLFLTHWFMPCENKKEYTGNYWVRNQWIKDGFKWTKEKSEIQSPQKFLEFSHLLANKKKLRGKKSSKNSLKRKHKRKKIRKRKDSHYYAFFIFPQDFNFGKDKKIFKKTSLAGAENFLAEKCSKFDLIKGKAKTKVTGTHTNALGENVKLTITTPVVKEKNDELINFIKTGVSTPTRRVDVSEFSYKDASKSTFIETLYWHPDQLPEDLVKGKKIIGVKIKFYMRRMVNSKFFRGLKEQFMFGFIINKLKSMVFGVKKKVAYFNESRVLRLKVYIIGLFFLLLMRFLGDLVFIHLDYYKLLRRVIRCRIIYNYDKTRRVLLKFYKRAKYKLKLIWLLIPLVRFHIIRGLKRHKEVEGVNPFITVVFIYETLIKWYYLFWEIELPGIYYQKNIIEVKIKIRKIRKIKNIRVWPYFGKRRKFFPKQYSDL